MNHFMLVSQTVGCYTFSRAGGTVETQLEWSDKFVFGLEDIDREHSQLFRTINDLIKIANEGGPGVEIHLEIVLEFLLNYVDTHFRDEEELFDQTDYPKKEEHKKVHQNFKALALKFKKRFSDGEKGIVDELIPILKKWLTDHILLMDKEYVQYCKEKGIGVQSKFSFSLTE